MEDNRGSAGENRTSGNEVGVIKILIIGDSAIGKSSLMLRFTKNEFSESHATTMGVEFKTKTVIVDGEQFLVQIWDTAGQERFNNITRTYYRRASGIIIAYDCNSRQTFENVREWAHRISAEIDDDVPVVISANKSDSEDKKVQASEGRNLAKELNLMIFETSSKFDQGISEMFDYMIRTVLTKKNIRYSRNSLHGSILSHSNPRNTTKKPCC